jgi:hypothetical protein
MTLWSGDGSALAFVFIPMKQEDTMRRQLVRGLSTIVSLCFAALALNAVAVPTAKAQDKVTKEYCKTHKNDPRCKDMDK